MKKFLIFLLVIAIIVVGYALIKNSGKLNSTKQNDSGAENVSGRQYNSPSANENGTYVMDKKVSSLSFSSSDQTVRLDLRSGNLVVDSGSVSGGTMEFSSSGIEKISGLEALKNTDIKLDIKALVFEREKSTADDLVYRTDTELTVNGKIYPVSFDSRFTYRPGDYSIVGKATPDWANWGITLPSGESVSLSLVFQAKK